MQIIIHRNDYRRNLFNGEIGVILRSPHRALRAVFARRGSYIHFPLEDLPSWKPAFAITVHKSQGSEFEEIFLILPPEPDHPLFTREILYTAITRARQSAALYSTLEVLKSMIVRQIERETGLRFW